MDRYGVAALRETRAARVLALSESVAESFGVTSEEVLGRSRRWPIPDARHELMTRLWEGGMPFAAIGRLLDRDHSTVMAGVAKVLRAQADKQARARLVCGP